MKISFVFIPFQVNDVITLDESFPHQTTDKFQGSEYQQNNNPNINNNVEIDAQASHWQHTRKMYIIISLLKMMIVW